MAFSKGYGWRPSLPDVRDLYHSFPRVASVPAEVDLRNSGFLPPIWDQSQIGSCVPHGVGAAYSFSLARQGVEQGFTPSRLFLYYNGRVIEGTVGYDSGLTITDGAKVLNRFGAPPETDWVYDITKYTEKPPAQAYADGLERQSIKYARVAQNASAMKQCLAAGTPIVIGFTVYESFESDAVAQTGDVPMPKSGEQVMGGHCVVVVGYTVRNGKPVWIIRNSWGTEWGDAGYCYMPQSYLTNTNLASDFWTVQQVESPDPAPQPPTPVPVADVVDRNAVEALIDKLKESVAAL